MKNILTLILLLFTVTLNGQDKFKAEFDYAVFPIDSNSGTFEIYYSFYQPGMNKIVLDEKEFVTGLLGVMIKNTETDSVILQKEYNFKIPFVSNGHEKNLNGLLRYSLKPGSYYCSLVGKDFAKIENMDTANFSFTVKVPPEDRFSISDIQMASSIKNNANSDSYFYKNTLEVIPNPELVYGENLPVLYFYSELYNVNKDIGTENLKVSEYVFDSGENLVYKKEKFVSRKNPDVVEVGAINLTKFPTGIYTLVVAADDSIKNRSIKSSKRFYVYNPNIRDTVKVLATSKIADTWSTYNSEELDEIFAISSYIATKAEKDAWKKLSNVEAKRAFLDRFWKSRDENTSTPQNETQIEYFKRVEFANKAFSNMLNKKGWKTDRGRVYILYGEPSEVERHPNEFDKRPYEIWYYEGIERGVKFIFADFTDFKDYRLIHSDKIGELQDENWQDRIIIN